MIRGRAWEGDPHLRFVNRGLPDPATSRRAAAPSLLCVAIGTCIETVAPTSHESPMVSSSRALGVSVRDPRKESVRPQGRNRSLCVELERLWSAGLPTSLGKASQSVTRRRRRLCGRRERSVHKRRTKTRLIPSPCGIARFRRGGARSRDCASVSGNGLPHFDEVAVPRGKLPDLKMLGNLEPKTCSEKRSLHTGTRRTRWQKCVSEFSHDVEVRQAEQGANVGQMCQELMEAWHALRHEKGAEAHGSHRAGMTSLHEA